MILYDFNLCKPPIDVLFKSVGVVNLHWFNVSFFSRFEFDVMHIFFLSIPRVVAVKCHASDIFKYWLQNVGINK